MNRKTSYIGPEKSNSVIDLIEKHNNAVRLVDKWKLYRDSLHSFYLIDKEKGQDKYNSRIGYLQHFIHSCMNKDGLNEIQAITKLANHFEGMLSLQILAAGFELLNGNDLREKYKFDPLGE
jgi:hypothetical protein